MAPPLLGSSSTQCAVCSAAVNREESMDSEYTLLRGIGPPYPAVAVWGMMKLGCVAVVAPAQVTCLGTESRELAHYTD